MDKLQVLLEDKKWDLIRSQFDGWTLSDIRKFTEAELLELVEPPLRLRTSLFIRTYLTPYLRDAVDPHASEINIMPPAEITNTCLHLRTKVCSSKFANFDVPGIPAERLTVWAYSVPSSDRMLIRSIDLSHNNLFDEDLPLISGLLELFPNCNVVDLTRNNIYGRPSISGIEWGVDKVIIQLLEKKITVILTYNPMGTIDRKDFFKVIENESPSLLEHLIWIPEGWLGASGWRSLVTKETAQEIVLKTHEAFYAPHPPVPVRSSSLT